MTPLAQIMGLAGDGLMVGILAGLAARRRFRGCASFGAYLVATLVPQVLVQIWPDVFYTWSFIAVAEAVQYCAKLALAVELLERTFAPFPGALRMGRFVFGGSVAWIAIQIPRALAMAAGFDASKLYVALQPPLLDGLLSVYVGLLILTLWYRLPIGQWHNAVVVGFGAFSVAQGAAAVMRTSHPMEAGLLGAAAFLATYAYWAIEAWRPERAVAFEPELVRVLQPWR